MIREEKVRELIAAASDGMTEVCGDATPSEVFSACLTMMAKVLQIASEKGAPAWQLQDGVYELLKWCGKDTIQ